MQKVLLVHCEFDFGLCEVILTVFRETLTTDKRSIVKSSLNMTSSSEQKSNNATQYSALQSKMQFKGGCLLNIKPGHKILDMGCGTGELTRFLAELVGENGEVVGVDPDE